MHNPMNDTNSILASIHQLRFAYRAVCQALPWLDMSVWPEDAPAFPAYAAPATGNAAQALGLERAMQGRLAHLKAVKNVCLARYAPAAGAIDDIMAWFAPELERIRLPLVILHTDVAWEKLEALAARYPKVVFIVESGPVKLLYHIQTVETIMLRQPNVWLCLANLCNWLGLERLVSRGLGARLLFGTHQPRFNPHAVMGPIVMSRLDWETKCNLAGNNLRRLLGLPRVSTDETPFALPTPFIVDAHTHSGPSGRFPVPDERFAPADWLRCMDAAGLAEIHVCPMETLLDPALDPRRFCGSLLAAAPGRVRYFDVFHPKSDAAQLRRLVNACRDPECAGIKIHPSTHQVAADDDAYAPVYALAETQGRTILTHSWDISATNPTQYLSHPDRFRKHLRSHPLARLVLGHAGGRPGSIPAVIALCREFPRVRVDLAGDYYDNGLIECLADGIGPGRIIFGSDMNWIDPRANLAPVLAAAVSDEAAARILRWNALETYGTGESK